MNPEVAKQVHEAAQKFRETAARAYDRAAIKYQGDFALLNFNNLREKRLYRQLPHNVK